MAVFDFGGVLIDWNPRHLYRKLIPDAGRNGAIPGRGDDARLAHACRITAAIRPKRRAACRPSIPTKHDLIAAFYGRFDEMCDHPFPEMAALVERLHEAGTPLYLLSNAPGLLDAWLRGPARQRHPFLGLFRDYVVSGPGRLIPSPTRAIYDLACRAGGFQPGDAVFIDDCLANVDGARAAGMARNPPPLGRPRRPPRCARSGLPA